MPLDTWESKPRGGFDKIGKKQSLLDTCIAGGGVNRLAGAYSLEIVLLVDDSLLCYAGLCSVLAMGTEIYKVHRLPFFRIDN